MKRKVCLSSTTPHSHLTLTLECEVKSLPLLHHAPFPPYLDLRIRREMSASLPPHHTPTLPWLYIVKRKVCLSSTILHSHLTLTLECEAKSLPLFHHTTLPPYLQALECEAKSLPLFCHPPWLRVSRMWHKIFCPPPPPPFFFFFFFLCINKRGAIC